MMFHMPYEGKGIKLRNGKLLRGKVMANPKYLSIRLNSGGRKRVNWNELTPSQFAEMLAYYAETRIGMDKKRDGAEDYMRAALFSDWYGNYDDAEAKVLEPIVVFVDENNRARNLDEQG